MVEAYDRVKWDFFELLLFHMCFDPYRILLIIQCVSTISYVVLINGRLQPLFNP